MKVFFFLFWLQLQVKVHEDQFLFTAPMIFPSNFILLIVWYNDLFNSKENVYQKHVTLCCV